MIDESTSTVFNGAYSDYGSDIDVGSTLAPSDYGSDFDPNDIDEDSLMGGLLAQLAVAAPNAAILPGIEPQRKSQGDDEGIVVHKSDPPALLRWTHGSPARRTSASVEFEYNAPSRRAFSVTKEEAPPETPTPTRDASQAIEDKRTPLERFRTKPRKPLSVTDLVSPAWCELQYFYTLSRFGRKQPTRAMRAGTKVHQALEDEVHTLVPVRVKSKEDRFGLRIWNAIQGIRCLRETGLTRELEVWGIVEGEVVNGVIDVLSYTCPDTELEQQLELSKAEQNEGILPLAQLNIKQAFAKAGTTTLEKDALGARTGAPESTRQVYIADVKTRGVRSIPVGASLRPTCMQLMLYRKLLESLSLNTVDAETVLARYNVSPLESFSDVFMLGIGAANVVDMHFGSENPDTVPQSNELYSHPNLLSLWSLLVVELQQTIPTVSDILRAEFRYFKTGDIIGSELFVYDSESIASYLKQEIEWWKGGREAKGVEIEEAFKCRVCDFADDCSWRKTKIEEATEKHRLRRGKMEKSAV